MTDLSTARHGPQTIPQYPYATTSLSPGDSVPPRAIVEASRMAHREAQRRYRATAKGQACDDRYNQSDKGRARYRRYRSTERGHLLRRLTDTSYRVRLRKRLYMQGVR